MGDGAEMNTELLFTSLKDDILFKMRWLASERKKLEEMSEMLHNIVVEIDDRLKVISQSSS